MDAPLTAAPAPTMVTHANMTKTFLIFLTLQYFRSLLYSRHLTEPPCVPYSKYMTYTNYSQLKIEIYADGAMLDDMLAALKQGVVKGFTTNPTLMKKAGVTNYETFARTVLGHITTLPISFEVFSDDFSEMELQANKINSWASNVFVKIPITNTKGQSAAPLIKRLAERGVKLNVTALLTTDQVQEVAGVLSKDVPSIVSVFAGRAADTGVNPLPLMKECLQILKPMPQAKPKYLDGSKLTRLRMLGWTIPAPSISIQPRCLHTEQPFC